MNCPSLTAPRRPARSRRLLATLTLLGVVLTASQAEAVPIFARQTGQNCVACHAGGQFPELTPYGRMFKMTGYTIGQRTAPLAAMAVASMSQVANTSKSDTPHDDFYKNGELIFATASLFLGGKVTDNIGAFAQITYDPYGSQTADGRFHGHASADNMDLRFADRFTDEQNDLIVGLSANNNPSVSDPWNTAAAWMQYVPVPGPSSSRFIDGNAPYPGFGAGGNIAGLSAYGLWQRHVYAELGGYATAKGLTHVFRAGLAGADSTSLKGVNPYWRLAYNHEWGPHVLMIGTSGMTSRVYDDPLATSDLSTLHRYRDLGVDAQYQYLLDPHSVTAQLAYMSNRHAYPAAQAGQAVAFVDAAGNALPNTNASDTTHVLRGKLTYVYRAKYGGSLGLFNLTGTRNTANLTAGYDPGTLTINTDPEATAPSVRQVDGNFTSSPSTRGVTLEAFWTPMQYVRVGAQFTGYSKFNGASKNYDGFGRNASDNNSLFLYTWVAY